MNESFNLVSRSEINTPTINDAMVHIESVRAKIMQYGNSDASESAALNKLSTDLVNGTLTTSEAINLANQLFESKNLR